MPSGNEVSVSVTNTTPVTVTVPGSIGSSPTITNGGTASVTVTSVGDRGPKGDTGPANQLTIGTVASGTAASATLTGAAGSQVLNLVLPKGETGAAGPAGSTGPAGPANSLSIGTVTTGAAGSSAAATITGTAPNQTLNLTIPRGDAGTGGSGGGVSWSSVPSSATATGTAGSIAYDSLFLYVCTASNTWKRAALSTWTPANSYTYTNTTPLAIPDPGTDTRSIVVTDSFTIADLNVLVEITHPYVADLRITLIAPSGDRYRLAVGPGAAGDNYSGTIFDSEATTPISAAFAPFTGNFLPTDPLTPLYGTNSAGTWQLEVQDVATRDSGTLTKFELRFTST